MVEEAALDVAPLLRRVAGAVGRDALGRVAVAVFEAPAGVGVDELRGLARRGEADDAQAAQDRLGDHVARLGQRARALAEGGVEQRRVPEDDRLLGLRRAVVGDLREGQSDELLGERSRVGDGRRGQDEARVGAVVAAQPAQATQHLCDVRAEDAAVHVRLVEHDVAQVVQELGPAIVGGEDADVQHVGVRQDDRGPRAYARALRLRRVAVVDGRDHAAKLQARQVASLVLGERLGGVEVEGAARRVVGERVEGRDGEAERLAARRARGDDDVPFLGEEVVRAALVAVEALRALRHQRSAQLRRKCVGQGRRASSTSGLVGHVDDLLVRAVEEQARDRGVRLRRAAAGFDASSPPMSGILPDDPDAPARAVGGAASGLATARAGGG